MNPTLLGIWTLLGTGAALLLAAGTIALLYGLTHPERVTPGLAIARGLPIDPDQLGLTANDVLFRFADGHTSPGWIIDGEQEHGPCIVVTHGWAGSRFGSLTRAPILARFASRVVVYDVRGHGESSAPTTALATKEPRDLFDVIEQATDPHDPHAPVVLFGSSMGAGATLVAAAQGLPDDPPNTHVIDRVVGVIAEGPYRWSMQPVVGQLREWRWPPYPFVWFAWLYLYLRHPGYRRFDRAHHAGRLRCPLLVIHGTADRICPIDSARQIADAAHDGLLVTFNGAGHGNLAAADPDLYAQTLANWLAALPTPNNAPAPRRRPTAEPVAAP